MAAILRAATKVVSAITLAVVVVVVILLSLASKRRRKEYGFQLDSAMMRRDCEDGTPTQ